MSKVCLKKWLTDYHGNDLVNRISFGTIANDEFSPSLVNSCIHRLMYLLLCRLLRWRVFFSSVSLQPHPGNIRSSITSPAGSGIFCCNCNLFADRKADNWPEISVITRDENLLIIVSVLILYLLSFPEHPSTAVRCCTIFRGSLASIHSSAIIISPLQTSPHMATQSQCARRTWCAWMYESLGKVWSHPHLVVICSGVV